MFAEAQLRRLLTIIDNTYRQCSIDLDGFRFDPLATIQFVNELQPLGKTKALAAVAEYCRVTESPPSDALVLALDLLFYSPGQAAVSDPSLRTESNRLPFGQPVPPGETLKASQVSSGDGVILYGEPAALVDDIPIVVHYGPFARSRVDIVQLGDPFRYTVLAALREHGRMRAGPLRPPDDFLKLSIDLEAYLANHPALRSLPVMHIASIQTGEPSVVSTQMVLRQLLVLMGAPLPREASTPIGATAKDADSLLAYTKAYIAAHPLRWDPVNSKYVPRAAPDNARPTRS
jgi:hypothetical protein